MIIEDYVLYFLKYLLEISSFAEYANRWVALYVMPTFEKYNDKNFKIKGTENIQKDNLVY